MASKVAISFFICLIFSVMILLGKKTAVSWIYTPIALFMSIYWLSFLAGIVIDAISFYSTILNISKMILAITFLALGNSLADLIANGSLSKLGYEVMACTGTLSGQVFNITLGLGLTLLRKTIAEAIPFTLFEESGGNGKLAVIGLSTSFINFSFVLFKCWKNNWLLDTTIAKQLLFNYVLSIGIIGWVSYNG